MKIGTTELIVILIVALVIFGPSKLPALGKMAGKAVGSFRHYVNNAEGWDLAEEVSKPLKTEATTTPSTTEPQMATATAAEPVQNMPAAETQA